MLALVCFIIAAILFLLSGMNEPIFNQPQVDEIAFGLFFLCLASALGGIGPPLPWRDRP